MSRRFWMAELPAGMVLFILSGCYSYNPYGYPSQYPGMPPAATYQSPVGAVPQTLSANPAYATPPAYDSGSDWQQSRAASPSVQLGAAADEFEAPTTDNEVPNYEDPQDPGDAFFNSSGDADAGNEPPARAIPRSGENEDVFGRGDEFGAIEPRNTEPAADAFLEPVPVQQVSQTTPAPEQDPNSPYAYEPTQLKWLRGTVDYDRQDGAWHLIYDLTPDPDDRFGGSITLAPDTRLEWLKEDDVILVEGSVDESLVDRLGKPRYRLTGVFPLEPKDETSGS